MNLLYISLRALLWYIIGKRGLKRTVCRLQTMRIGRKRGDSCDRRATFFCDLRHAYAWVYNLSHSHIFFKFFSCRISSDSLN